MATNGLRYWEASDGLYLVRQPVGAAAAVPVSRQLNQIGIFDRSLSMSYELPGLIRRLKERIRAIPIGDTLTLGWFSSEGQFAWIFRGLKLTGQADYAAIEKTLDRYASCVGTTCFSEILADVATVIEDLRPFSEYFSLWFMTDGYPVVSNYRREVEAINRAIDRVKGQVAATLLVGFGNYYNRDLLADMALRAGGSLIHSTDLMTMGLALDNFARDSREVDLRQEVVLAVPATENLVFAVQGTLPVLYQPEGGKVLYAPTGGDEAVYVLTSQRPIGAVQVALSEADLRGATTNEAMARAAYAAALVLSQRARTDRSLEVLGQVGDRALVRQLINAFTNDEFGRVEARIAAAMTEPASRLVEGYDTNFLPPRDAFCLLDALRILTADDDAYFYPRHPEWRYKRIGVPSVTEPGYPDFVEEANPRCRLDDLTWNESFLNLSVRAMIRGTVDLKGDAAAVGLANPYPAIKYRNYALVKDGFPNVQRLPVSLAELSFNALQAGGLIAAGERWAAGQVYVLDMTTVPVINRAMADGRTSLTELCQSVAREKQLMGELKALRFLRDEVDPDKTAGKTPLNAAQEAFLEGNGIKGGVYSPPSARAKGTDRYIAKEFKIKMGGFSSFPKVEEVRQIILDAAQPAAAQPAGKKPKKLNAPGETIRVGLALFDAALPGLPDKDAKVAWLDATMRDLKRELAEIRSRVQATKFAVILGNRQFDEFSSREECELEVGGAKFTVVRREVPVDL